MEDEITLRQDKKLSTKKTRISHTKICSKGNTKDQLSGSLKKLPDGCDKNKPRTVFTDMVHEIRTPMGAIKNFSELLLTQNLNEQEITEYIELINKCADDLLSMVNDYLDLSKIDVGQLTLEELPCSLNDLFYELHKLFNTPCCNNKSKDVVLKYYLDLELQQCYIKTDFMRLKQILVNLIGNALKFTQSGYVLFGCRLVGGNNLQFSVKDTGSGIPYKMQAVIFERYKQSRSDCPAECSKGTGLGLSIVKSLVDLMGGEIRVQSKPGQGSTFYFNLPFIKCNNKNSSTYKAEAKETLRYIKDEVK